MAAQSDLTAVRDLGRRQALLWLSAITVLAAVLRFYGLRWGAPYHQFHLDEHYVFLGAAKLRVSMEEAANLYKFFMYPPFVMHLLNAVRSVYELITQHRLDLTVPRDQITYMVMGRTISAAFGTATIPLVYLVAARVSGRLAGVFAAFLLAIATLHLRDSHFFTTDIAMTFLTVVTWWCALRVADGKGVGASIGSGVAFGAAVVAKYTAVFLAPIIAIAHLLAPVAAGDRRDAPWFTRRVLWAALAGVIGVAVFFVIDPMVLFYPARFREDIREQVTAPLLAGESRQWLAQFGDVSELTYWFTNLLWWGLGPALEIWALAGVVWLFLRRDRAAFISAAFPVAYWLMASRSAGVFPRYAVPLVPPLAICAACLSVDWLNRPRLRFVSLAATTVVFLTTAFWGLAYMNVYRHPDARLEAGRWAMANIPEGANVLVEPSQGTPPMGNYLANVNFNQDYVVWHGRDETGERDDHFHLVTMDMYRSLWNTGTTDDWRRAYVQSRLDKVDWIVMDDHFFVQYSHQPEGEHSVAKQYYRDLFAERLGFRLIKTFKTYPSLFGITINDDDAELTFHDLDHPKVYIFRRFRSP